MRTKIVAYYQDDLSKNFKLKLIDCIRCVATQKGWSQTHAAKEFGISRSRLCRVLGGQTKDVSEGRLIQCLITLGSDIKIHITPAQDSTGNVEISNSYQE